jgi:hypothetical protein
MTLITWWRNLNVFERGTSVSAAVISAGAFAVAAVSPPAAAVWLLAFLVALSMAAVAALTGLAADYRQRYERERDWRES